MRSAPPLVLLVVLAGCSGALHHEGDRVWTVGVHYGDPIHGRALWWESYEGASNGGFSVGHHWFLRDRLAIALSLSPLLVYDQRDGAAYGTEAQAGFRCFPVEAGGVAFFFDLFGGFGYYSRSVPPTGSHANFTLEFGPGVELRLSDSVSLLTGYHLRHLSNAHGRVAGNPGQNDHRFWIGFAIDW